MVGKRQRAAMWAIGILLTLGFLGDVIDYFVFESPREIDVMAELGWTLLFLVTLAAVEGVLYILFRAWNARARSA